MNIIWKKKCLLIGVFVKCSGLPGNIVRVGPGTILHKAVNSGVGGFPRRVYSFPRTLLEYRGRAEVTGRKEGRVDHAAETPFTRKGTLLRPFLPHPPQLCTVGNAWVSVSGQPKLFLRPQLDDFPLYAVNTMG